LLAEPPLVEPLAPAAWKNLHAGDYRDLVRAAIAQIELGGLRKIVCARAVDHDLPGAPDTAACLAHLHRHADERTYVYARDLDDGGICIGATPELLFHANGSELTVLSLAGSRPRGKDAASDAHYAAELLGSTKERKEHQLVIEHLARQLRARADAVHIPSTPTVRQLARMQHLETVLHCRIGDLDPFDLLTALAPTPAVAGLPQSSAVEWLRRHEGLHRGLYTGSLGLIAPGLARFVVPLRGGVLRDQRARLFAGAGIVETSEAEAELAETELKLRPMRQALGVE
jgi:isochorismate synthase